MRIYGCLKITEGLSEKALGTLRNKLGTVSVLLYNVVDARMKHILDETADDLTNGFRISVANALAWVQELMPELKENKGAILLTGGGTTNYPMPEMGIISLGKAGIRSLAIQLHKALRKDDVYAGTLTIAAMIDPNSPTHSPDILARKFLELYQERSRPELVYWC